MTNEGTAALTCVTDVCALLGLSGQATSAALLAFCVRFFECKMRSDTIVTGHLNLNGDVAAVGSVNAKIKGAKAWGYRRMLIPDACLGELSDECRSDPELEIVTASNVVELLNHCLDGFRKYPFRSLSSCLMWMLAWWHCPRSLPSGSSLSGPRPDNRQDSF